MAVRASVWLLTALSFFTGTYARVVQDDFVSPSLPDESVTIKSGTNYTIEWTGQLYTWFAAYAPSANISDVDLYITGTDNPNYEHLVQAAIDVQATRSVNWVVQLPDNELSDTPYWTFRFIRGGSSYTGPDGEQISSPRIIVQAVVATTTTTSSSSSSSATATSTTSTTSTSASATSLPGSTTGNPSLSGGAIAGIVIGVVAALALLAALIWFVGSRRRKQRHTAASPAAPMSTIQPLYSGDNREFYATKPPLANASENRPPQYNSGIPYVELPGVSPDNRAQLP